MTRLKTRNDRSMRPGLWVAALAVLLWGLAGCESGGKEASAGANVQTAGGPAGQAGDEGSGGAGGGTASIDHGGITELPTGEALVKKGKSLFQSEGCAGCHKMESKLVGPPLGDVTERREVTWLARMILHPDKMLKVDPTAKKLLAEHMTPMPNQGLSPEQAKAIIAYLGDQK